MSVEIINPGATYAGAPLQVGETKSFDPTTESRLVSSGYAKYKGDVVSLLSLNGVIQTSDGKSLLTVEVDKLTGGIKIFGEAVTKNITPGESSSSTCYMFRSPITLATSRISDQREIYIPTETARVFVGAYFGKRILAYTSETMTDLGLFQPGLHTWHGSLAKAGTWVAGPANQAAGAFQSTGGTYSLTAGDTISGSITGTAAAIRTFLTSVGGYAVVSIDGDWTRANKLPTFTTADYASGACRESDVGKRYYSSYSGITSSDCICLANDLAAGTHTITVEATGTKPAAASAARAYVEAFVGCNGETLGAANVFAVPIQWIYHDIGGWSAMDSVTKWAPSGSTDYQFLGNIHGDNVQSKEVTTTLSWVVGVTDQTSLAQGSWASGEIIRCDHVSTVAHKASTSTPVATRTRRWTFSANRKLPIMLDYKIEWLAAGVCSVEYPMMLPLGEVVTYTAGMKQDAFTVCDFGYYHIPIPANHDNSSIFVLSEYRRVIVTGSYAQAWAEVISDLPGNGMYAAYTGFLQDRSQKDCKIYTISATGPQPYAVGDVQRFVTGWGARLI